MTIGDQGGGGVQHGACHGCNKEVNKVLVMDMVMEGLVDKEVAKLMEEVNKVMVMDMVLEGVVDNR